METIRTKQVQKIRFDQSGYYFIALMVLWVSLLIIQPLLVRKKKLELHRMIGRLTYVLMPVMLISVLLILNSGMKAVPAADLAFANVLFPVRDFFFLAIYFSIGVVYRHQVQIHARAMIVTGIVFIEPALFRFVGGEIGIPIILGLLITLIVIERKQKQGRWLFPAFLMVDVMVYLLVIFEVSLSFLDPLVRWFVKLPLT